MEEFYYPSKGEGQIHACRWAPEGPVRAVVQFVHGLSEYVSRYDGFARYLNEHGLVMVGEDHMGHGKSVGENGTLGYFAGGWDAAVADVHTLYERTRKDFPGVPYFLMGHSMGSFLVRSFLIRYPNSSLRGAVVMATGWAPEAVLRSGKAIISTLIRTQGETAVSNKVQDLVFGTLSKPFCPPEGPMAWVCSNEEVLESFLNDPLCGFPPTNGLVRDMIDGLRMNQSRRNLDRMIKTLPVLFVSGAEDPLGDMGKGVEKTRAAFEKAGMLRTGIRLYPKMRHGILGETGREQVCADLLAWMLEQLF